MSFLFRLPLFHFNIEDPESLKRNWEHILMAIHLSSPIFYKELQGKSLEELDPKQQIKLRKYLLRGRYRPTPFGRFAGVGIGNWGTEIKFDFPLIPSEINPSTSSHSTLSNQIKLPGPILLPHRLIPGIITKHNHYHALIYDNSISKWKGCKLPVNPLMEIIINQASEDSLSFHQFSQLLSTKGSGISQDQIEKLWENILSSGLLVPSDTRENIKSGVDIIIKNKLNLPKTIKDQLEKFIHSSGNLFGKEESLYIRDFKKYFMEQFDDRQVLLSELLSDTNFLSGQFLKNTLEPEIEDKFSAILTDKDIKPIDLQKSFDKKEPEKDIYDIQILFRLDMQGNPVIENIVCNRPFVYTGRFNREPIVNAHTYEIKNRIFTDPEVIYAHVQLYESKPIQHISNVINVFDLEITPFQSSLSNQLSFEELYIGIWDNRILLLDKHSHKQVIPVILHPLNGEQITHPILRLLWEIAHQNRFRFLPYQSESLTKLPYSPQLNWGEICLQNRK